MKPFQVMKCICTKYPAHQFENDCRIKEWQTYYTIPDDEWHREHPGELEDGFYGMPVLGVYQTCVQGVCRQWYAWECPRCGRGGFGITADKKRPRDALKEWNKMQKELWAIADEKHPFIYVQEEHHDKTD